MLFLTMEFDMKNPILLLLLLSSLHMVVILLLWVMWCYLLPYFWIDGPKNLVSPDIVHFGIAFMFFRFAFAPISLKFKK